MQPDPLVYLSGASSALLKMVEKSESLTQAESITLRRISQMLDMLHSRHGETTLVLNSVLGEEVVLLKRACGLIEHCGESLPASSLEALSKCETFTEEGGPEADLQQFEAIKWAQLDALKLLLKRCSSNPGEQRELDTLLESIRRIEQQTSDTLLEQQNKVRQEKMKEIDTKSRGTGDCEVNSATLERFLRTNTPGVSARISDLRLLSAINSKDIYSFSVFGIPGWPEKVIMRSLRDFSANPDASMQYEFDLLTTLREHAVPVPRPLALDRDGSAFGHESIFMEMLPGKAVLPGTEAMERGAGAVSLGRQVAGVLARIHQVPLADVDPEMAGTALREQVRQHIQRQYELWRSHQVEPSLVLEDGFSYVLNGVDGLSENLVLVHGDFDFRNLLIDDMELVAVLDWERSHLGHPAEDIAYCRSDIQNIMDWDDFLLTYEQEGGYPVTTAEIRLFHVWSYVFKLSCIEVGMSAFKSGELDDFLLASTGFVEYYEWSAVLRELLTEYSQVESNV